MKIWLLEPSVAAELRAARDAGLAPTAEQQAAYEARERTAITARDGVPRNLSIAGNTAEIRVEGILTEKLDFFAFLFGGGNTTYASIRDAVAAAEADPNVRQVVYMVASPGGTVDGLFETLAIIDAAKKPATVVASQATSAAYAIAAVAGKIKANTPAAQFGSIGVAASVLNLEEVVDITNTESPDKRPDVSTDEGKKVVQRQLDGIFEVFTDAIAQGRGVDVKDVVENYGRGAVLVAKEAKRIGMIDAVPGRVVTGARAEMEAAPVAEASAPVVEPTPTEQIPSAQSTESKSPASASDGGAAKRSQSAGRKPMTEDELRAQHPELYTAVLNKGEASGHAKGKDEGLAEGREQGVKEGSASERKRVLAHLKLGKNCGAMDLAMKHIESGVSTLDEEAHADYMIAGRNKRDSDNRQADSDAAGKALDNRETDPEDKNTATSVIDAALNLEAERVADVVEAKK